MRLLIISCSLNPTSNSRILAQEVFQLMKEKEQVEFIDLRDYDLPACDGDSCYKDENVQRLTTKIAEAHGIVIATPVYNYNASSAAKNLIELTDQVWEQKVVGFLCAAGGKASYMAVLGLANSLMLDFKTYILPRFVYAIESDFGDGEISNKEIRHRLMLFGEEMIKITKALKEANRNV